MSTSFGWERKSSCGSFRSGWTRGVQVKLWDPLRTHAMPECLRVVFMTRHYTNPRLPLPLHHCCTTDGIFTAFEFCDGIGEGVDWNMWITCYVVLYGRWSDCVVIVWDWWCGCDSCQTTALLICWPQRSNVSVCVRVIPALMLHCWMRCSETMGESSYCCCCQRYCNCATIAQARM